MVFAPWRAGRIVARPPLRVRYSVLVGLLWFPALVGGGHLGHTRPRLPPVWCAAGFAVASIVVLRIASEASMLPLVLVRWLAA